MLRVFEGCAYCPLCDALTAHASGGLRAWHGGLVATCLGGFLGPPGLVVALGGVLTGVLYLRHRQEGGHLSCGRCRSKARARHRRTTPTLDGKTEILL